MRARASWASSKPQRTYYVTRPDAASAARFMHSLVFRCGLPIKGDGSGLQDWKVYAVGQGDSSVTVVITRRDAGR